MALPSILPTALPTALPTVLLIGACGEAAHRLYLRPLLALQAAGRMELTGCDVKDGERELAPLPFVRCPRDWSTWSGSTARQVLERRWDTVLVATPARYHCGIARRVGESQLAMGHPCRLLIEKPLADSDGDARALCEWKRRQDPDGLLCLRVVDHYGHSKWAVQKAAEIAERLQVARWGRASLVSYEQQPMWPSEAFAEGYLIEHAAGHAPSALNAVAGIGAIRLDRGAPLAGGRYVARAPAGPGLPLCAPAPTDYETWATAGFRVDTLRPETAGVPFVISVGKGMSCTEKWLCLDGADSAGKPIVIRADLERKRLLYLRPGAGMEVLSSPDPDGYPLLVPRLVSPDRSEVEAATDSLEEARSWLQAVSEAAQAVRGKLMPYAVGEDPPGANAHVPRIGGF